MSQKNGVRFVLISSLLCAAFSINCILLQQAYAASHATASNTPSSLANMSLNSAAVISTTSNGGWITADTDAFTLISADHKAEAVGAVSWYHGKFPRGYLHRGEYTLSSTVTATHPVGCIWAQITWGYPMGSISFPPGASIQGAEQVSKFFVACRSSGSRSPSVLMLNGLSYAKALLNSTTLTICTSATKQEGPRNCGAKKMYYGLG